jgi:nitrate reductase assembly molybdenum cofactor insertion protein NarJ
MNNKNLKHYEKLAMIFQYPDTEYSLHVREVESLLSQLYPETQTTFIEFAKIVYSASLEELEELFARTFDVQAITTLDIGYVLFGDDYKRGELLVNLNREHREAGNDCGNELADNLSNLLKLLPKMKDSELRHELIQKIIMPALTKIIKEFEVESINLKNKIYKKQFKTIIEQSEDYGRIYRYPLTVVYKIIEKDYGYVKPAEEENKNSFTDSITSEIKID